METEEEKTPADGVQCIDGVDVMMENINQTGGVETPRFRNETLDLSSEKRKSNKDNSCYMCTDCSREFSSKRALGAHNRAHRSSPLPPSSSSLMVDSSAGSFSLEDREASPPPRHLKRWRTTPNTIGAPATAWRSGYRNSFAHKESPEAEKTLTGGTRGTAIADIKLEEVDNASVAAPMTETTTSRSLDDVSGRRAADDDIVTDAAAAAANNVCGICRLDFDNRNQLSSHELSCKAENYDLRRNPKRSRRFIDQDQHDIPYAAPAAASLPPRPRFSITAADDELCACSFCGKEFQSPKAMYGHLRCHPDRNYRGIPKPKVAKVGLEETSRVDRLSTHQEHQGGRAQESDTESEGENVRARREALGKAKAVVGPADDSDMESMETLMGLTSPKEATEQNIEQHELTMPPSSVHSSTSFSFQLSARRKRSKRNGFRVRVPNVTMMLHETEDENKLNVKEAVEGMMVLLSLQEAALVISEQVEQVVPDEARAREASELGGNNENATAGADCQDVGALRGDQGEGGEDDRDGEQGAIIYKFQCNNCKKKFKSHQALGGHRASHKRIKGCHAQDASSDGVQDQEIVSDDRFPSNLLPSEFPDLCKMEEGVKIHRQLSTTISNSKEVSGDLPTETKPKHPCTLCSRIFDTGQALGGHMHSHTKKDGSSPEATCSTNTTHNQSATAVKSEVEGTHHSSFGTARSGLAEIAEDRRIRESQLGQMGRVQLQLSLSHNNGSPLVPPILSPIVSVARRSRLEFFDLNLPAPADDDDSEGNGSNRTPATVLLDSLGNQQCALSLSM